MSSPLKLISEGSTEVFVSLSTISGKGPGSKQEQPFYNPAMEHNRDLSIVFMQWFLSQQKKHVTLLDGLAASGIRGIRLAHELSGDFTVVINDRDPQAYALIQKNIEHNQLINAVACNKNLQEILLHDRFQYIDIDPFGSPVYYLNNAVQSITHSGVIACTATDTAALCGVYPNVCLRRYSAVPYHSVCMHEIGLRILLGVIGRDAARYDLGIEPLLSYAFDHYFRVYVRIQKGKHFANDTMQHIRMIPAQMIPMSKQGDDMFVGPLWMGSLHHTKTVGCLRTCLFQQHVRTKQELWKLLSLLEEEADMPPFFYSTCDIASSLRISAPRLKTVFTQLQQKGFRVSRTHFQKTGFKTTAPYDAVEEVFKKQK